MPGRTKLLYRRVAKLTQLAAHLETELVGINDKFKSTPNSALGHACARALAATCDALTKLEDFEAGVAERDHLSRAKHGNRNDDTGDLCLEGRDTARAPACDAPTRGSDSSAGAV
jgi:hypothetical protein